MNKVAETMARAEKALGLDSRLVNVHEVPSEQWDQYADADIHVPHTHFPNEMKKRLTRPLKMVFLGHGTPEYIFQSSVESGKQGYGHGDGLMLWMHWMKVADAVVTFWPRHQAIMKSMCDKNTPVHLVPLGLETAFWKAGRSKGKFAGNPSVMMCENSHFMKWSYDMFVAWPWVYEQVPDACLHVNYLPVDQHRWFFPLINRNGASYGSFVSPSVFKHEDLRNVLNSVDYYANLVRYGDFNRMGMEASLCGAKVISYPNNPYANYWIQEGSQVKMAEELTAIFKGQVEPRTPDPIPDAKEMAEAMKVIYESIC
jgi:hypothetical protein